MPADGMPPNFAVGKFATTSTSSRELRRLVEVLQPGHDLPRAVGLAQIDLLHNQFLGLRVVERVDNGTYWRSILANCSGVAASILTVERGAPCHGRQARRERGGPRGQEHGCYSRCLAAQDGRTESLLLLAPTA